MFGTVIKRGQPENRLDSEYERNYFHKKRLQSSLERHFTFVRWMETES